MKGVIRTRSGAYVNVFDPDPASLLISDIAHGLSHVCRFGGHTPRFYSVAQHSILVARRLPPELRLEGLLHDASEAYLGDMPTPIKDGMPEYRIAEDRMQRALAEKFGVGYPFHALVHEADAAQLRAEFSMFDGEWAEGFMQSEVAAAEFFKMYELLAG